MQHGSVSQWGLNQRLHNCVLISRNVPPMFQDWTLCWSIFLIINSCCCQSFMLMKTRLKPSSSSWAVEPKVLLLVFWRMGCSPSSRHLRSACSLLNLGSVCSTPHTETWFWRCSWFPVGSARTSIFRDLSSADGLQNLLVLPAFLVLSAFLLSVSRWRPNPTCGLHQG